MRKFKICWQLKHSNKTSYETVYALDESSAKHVFLYVHDPSIYVVLDCQEILDD